MKKILSLAVIHFFFIHNLFSQYYFYVSPICEQAKPNLQKQEESNNETLNQLFKEFHVTRYKQSFPNAKDIKLHYFSKSC